MKYLIVLQWPANCTKDYDTMIDIEAVLSEHSSQHSEVDGHDAGSGEMNIFIHTDDPVAAFNEVRAALRDVAIFRLMLVLRIVKSRKAIIPSFGPNI